MPSNVKLLAGASGGEPTDANFKNVTLLLHGDGSNGAQNNTFIDSSTNNFTITRNGNTTQGSFSPYGSNWSNYFDGSGDYLTISSNAAFDFGTSDFTIECWFLMNSSSSNMSMVNNYNAGTSGWGIQYRSDFGEFRFFWGDTVLLSYAATPTIGSWTHIAVARSGTSLKMYINGTQVASATNSTSLSGGSSVVIGAINASGYVQNFNGYISNVRVLKGTALYTSAFTPSTTPLTAITNTSLLTCAYNRFRDGSTNNFTITRNGDVKVTNFAPFAPSSAYSTTTNGGSAYFDGSGDYLSGPTSSSFDFGTGDFTVEAWFYMSALPALNASSERVASISAYTGGTVTANQGWEFYVNATTNRLVFSSWGSSNKADCSFTVSLGTWYHVAATRSGGTTRLFVNGVSQTLTTNTLQTNNDTNANIRVGTSRGDSGYEHDFPGYLSNLRIVKGTAVYTADFTIPSSPVTAVTNTQLLTNFTNAAIFDNSMKNDLETVGNAQISTSVKKFGTGSIAFDGNGDALVAAYSDALNVTSGDFTIEGWVYFNAVSGTTTLITPFGTGTDYGGWVIALDSSSRFTYYLSSSVNSWNLASNVLFSSTAAVTGTWYHFALVRSGSTFTPYLNGTAGTTTTTSSALYNHSRPIKLGAEKDANSFPLNGYLDDVRITKGVARYTANFTAPTAPFPNK